jgi:hypothetical protein
MLKTRRMQRFANLRRLQFTKFEAVPLSKVSPAITPYFREMMKERAEMAAKAFKMGVTGRQFEAQIKELYRVNRWVKRNRAGQIIADPWKMFREFEDKFKQKTPAYTSPWQKRQKNMRDFVAKLERTIRIGSGHERG